MWGRQQVLWDVAPEKGLVLTTAFAVKKWSDIWPLPIGLSQVEQLAREKGIAGNLSGLWLLFSFPLFFKDGILGCFQKYRKPRKLS